MACSIAWAKKSGRRAASSQLNQAMRFFAAEVRSACMGYGAVLHASCFRSFDLKSNLRSFDHCGRMATRFGRHCGAGLPPLLHILVSPLLLPFTYGTRWSVRLMVLTMWTDPTAQGCVGSLLVY